MDRHHTENYWGGHQRYPPSTHGYGYGNSNPSRHDNDDEIYRDYKNSSYGGYDRDGGDYKDSGVRNSFPQPHAKYLGNDQHSQRDTVGDNHSSRNRHHQQGSQDFPASTLNQPDASQRGRTGDHLQDVVEPYLRDFFGKLEGPRPSITEVSLFVLRFGKARIYRCWLSLLTLSLLGHWLIKDGRRQV